MARGSTNDVGIDEFVTLCRLLDVEPYVTVNAGFGDEWSAAQLVTVGEKAGVQVQEQEVDALPEEMPPFSVSIYSFPVQ